MINVDKLCKGCMREIENPDGICPICGYDNQQQETRSSKALRENTILNGRYLLGRVLGEGGFGITYLAVDLVSDRVVAVKEYFPVGLSIRDMLEADRESLTILPGEAGVHFRNGLERFTREGEILSRFQNLPGIVNARDFFFANETAYLVMDYIEGQSLKQYMKWYQQKQKGEPMDYRVAIAFLEPVIQSLIQIHNAGLIHRDISPDNILVNNEGTVTLIDFGSAREDRGTDFYTMTVMVKHGYAPEEQYRTHGKQGPWTDVYALCATLYHIISGTLPMEAVERLYQDDLVPLKELKLKISVPEEISDIISAGMAVRCQDRIQSMDILWKSLEKALEKQDKLEVEEALLAEARRQEEQQAIARRRAAEEEEKQKANSEKDAREAERQRQIDEKRQQNLKRREQEDAERQRQLEEKRRYERGRSTATEALHTQKLSDSTGITETVGISVVNEAAEKSASKILRMITGIVWGLVVALVLWRRYMFDFYFHFYGASLNMNINIYLAPIFIGMCAVFFIIAMLELILNKKMKRRKCVLLLLTGMQLTGFILLMVEYVNLVFFLHLVVFFLYLLLFALILTGVVWKKRKENRSALLCMIIVILLIVAALIIFIFYWKYIYFFLKLEYQYLRLLHPLLVGPVSILLEFIGMLLYGRNRKNK